MAARKATETVAVEVAEQPEKRPVSESVYFIPELVEQHKFFSTSKELVYVALKLSGMDKFTVKEARKIIEAYKNKEVK